MLSKCAAHFKKVSLFQKMSEEEIIKVLGCLEAHTCDYMKGASILMYGDTVHNIGIVLEGKVTATSSYLLRSLNKRKYM